LPVGKIVSQPTKGDFLTLPILGWVSIRQQTETPLVMLGLILFQSVEDPQPRGTLHVELPIFEETEQGTVACLERYGWKGKVYYAGTEPQDEVLEGMMETAGLRATFIFEQAEDGSQPAQNVSVQRARGPFLMPPLPDPEEPPDPKLVEKLRTLINDPKQFWPEPKKEDDAERESDSEGESDGEAGRLLKPTNGAG